MKFAPDIQRNLLHMAIIRRQLEAGGAEIITPEQAELDELLEQQRRLRDATASAAMAVEDMETEILRIQADERKLRRRVADDREALRATTDPEKRRDLEHDEYSAKSRIADLLSELAEAHNEIHALRSNHDNHGARLDELNKKVDLATRARDAAAESRHHLSEENIIEDIARIRAELPAELVEAYDAAYQEYGVGAAFFNGRSCGGCHMVLPANDRTRIRNLPEDELAECPNCATLLVRTSLQN